VTLAAFRSPNTPGAEQYLAEDWRERCIREGHMRGIPRDPQSEAARIGGLASAAKMHGTDQSRPNEALRAAILPLLPACAQNIAAATEYSHQHICYVMSKMLEDGLVTVKWSHRTRIWSKA
jgi:hypothetical protein